MNYILKLPLIFLPLLSMLFNFILFLKIKKLAKESEDIHSSKNQLIYLIKKRYSDCLTLGKPIQNSLSFVQKYFYNNCTDIIYCRTLHHFFKFCFFLLLTIYFFYNVFPSEKLIFTSLSAFFIFQTLSDFFDTSYYEKKFETSMCDYLDNIFYNRLKTKKEVCKPNEINTDESFTPPTVTNFTKKCTNTDNENAIIASIINDFL